MFYCRRPARSWDLRVRAERGVRNDGHDSCPERTLRATETAEYPVMSGLVEAGERYPPLGPGGSGKAPAEAGRKRPERRGLSRGKPGEVAGNAGAEPEEEAGNAGELSRGR